jgi:hypothetical protein
MTDAPDPAAPRITMPAAGVPYRWVEVSGELTSPSGIVGLGDLAIVAELHGRLAVIDADDRFVGTIGAGDLPDDREARPNARLAEGSVGRPTLVPGRFNSPHAVDIGPDGSLFVAEFVLGGRLVRLTPD